MVALSEPIRVIFSLALLSMESLIFEVSVVEFRLQLSGLGL